MKRYTYIIFIITFVCLMIPSVCQAVTLQWSYTIGTTGVQTNVYVEQIVADGKGGCAAVWFKTKIPFGITYIARFDKKGTKLWERTYEGPTVKISYCDKKKVVFCVSAFMAGTAETYVIDNKGVEDIVYVTTILMNDRIGPAGDKKGFFAQNEFFVIYGDISINRYSYK